MKNLKGNGTIRHFKIDTTHDSYDNVPVPSCLLFFLDWSTQAAIFVTFKNPQHTTASGALNEQEYLIASIEIDHFIELVELLLFDSALFNESPGGILTKMPADQC